MSAAPGRAVFLSYASQDAEAAKRICEALRAAGVEVWFDQNELVGGDAWDAKIRKQIKECALLIPIISAGTQARTEGYFRLEWRLADQRTHLMAKGRPFLLPVVIDGTTDAEAAVPDSFTEVQWTKAPGGEVPVAFVARVQKLLGGAEAATDRPRPSETGEAPRIPARRRRSQAWWVLPVLLAVAAGSFLLWLALRPASDAVGAPSVPLSDARKLVTQARQIYESGDEINRENIVFAEDLVKRALALDPADPEAWELAARLSHALVWYSLDASEPRRELLLQQANRARALAPQSVSAQLVAIDTRLALNFGRVTLPPDFENEVRDLVTREPGNWNAQRAWSTLLRFIPGRQQESLAAIRRAVELSDGHPGVVADLINTLVRQRQFAEADAVMVKYLPTRPTGRLLCWDVILRLRWRGGPEAAQQSLARFPTWLVQEDRGLFLAWQTWYWSRDPVRALRAAQAAPRDYVQDFSFYGPRAALTARAHELAGNVEAARADWHTTLARAERELALDAQAEDALYWKAWALARLDRVAEARVITAQLRQRNRNGPSAFFKGTSLAALLATTGEIDETLAEISARLNTLDDSIGLTRPSLELDPAFEPLRRDPRFQALLQQAPAPEEEKTAASGDDKSVAVLAFANLSDDKANEYFSDGISEELLNVLAKVPGLKVSARTSAFHFKGKNTPIPEIARLLGVAYVVEGSVRKAGDKVRIQAQLIKAADGFRVWNDTFTRDMRDVFAVQDEIAGLIAKSLSLQLGASSSRKFTNLNPQAFELYVQARQAWSLRTPEGFARAEQLLNRALELAPDFVRARAALIDVVQMRSLRERRVGSFGQRHSPEIDQRLAEVREVLALDPDLAEAYSTLGQTLDSKWLRDEEGQAYRRATELNPNYATGRQWYGMHLAELGYMDEALAELKAAAELDPFSFIILDNYGWLLNLAGRTTEALQMLDRAAALNPGFDQTARVRAVALKTLGRTAEADAIARGLRNNQRELDIWTLGTVGLHAEAKALLNQMDPRDVTNRFQALLSAGEREAALVALADPSGASKGDSIDILYQPIFDPIRTESRFIEYLSVLGLTEAHQRAQAWRRLHLPGQPEANR